MVTKTGVIIDIMAVEEAEAIFRILFKKRVSNAVKTPANITYPEYLK